MKQARGGERAGRTGGMEATIEPLASGRADTTKAWVLRQKQAAPDLESRSRSRRLAAWPRKSHHSPWACKAEVVRLYPVHGPQLRSCQSPNEAIQQSLADPGPPCAVLHRVRWQYLPQPPRASLARSLAHFLASRSLHDPVPAHHAEAPLLPASPPARLDHPYASLRSAVASLVHDGWLTI
ncbi:hypothetical protein GGTG_05983 [Gaeumannomyces tritici R3-111a-1]|uniref:Uncharacterized protein n=1 Tax=Gaeumannomyces tritici (strain R3-111a-1) TaxID=644352 RepID=J3NXH7_GAET3|nr:hypothetical protein GGTG_05983 [Gaeumannomyces tritici R3-111a-1]EJT76059.1 hypothetical protein GGTG_05983 [Gaeumannomyces tritici R3-111a-1]